MRMGFTPTTTSPPDYYLRKMIDEGVIREHNYGLREENCWLEGAPTPWLTQQEIDAFEQELLPVEREMRMGRSWDPVVAGRWIVGYDDKNYNDDLPPVSSEVRWGVGIDHGAQAGKQVACLIAVQQGFGEAPRVWYVDMCHSDGMTSPDQDADAILDMLARNELAYGDVEVWVGDRALEAKRGAVKKGNQMLRFYLAAQLGRNPSDLERISLPKKFEGSVMWGCQLMNALFLKNRASIRRPACSELRDAVLQFRGSPVDPLKDVLDAARYITERMVQPGRWMSVSSVLRVN
jgi:hypothetical protein